MQRLAQGVVGLLLDLDLIKLQPEALNAGEFAQLQVIKAAPLVVEVQDGSGAQEALR